MEATAFRTQNEMEATPRNDPNKYHLRLGDYCSYAHDHLGEDIMCGYTLGCASCIPMFEEEVKRRARPTICYGRYAWDSEKCKNCSVARECAERQGNPRAFDISRRPVRAKSSP